LYEQENSRQAGNLSCKKSVIEGDDDIRGADQEAARLDLSLRRRPSYAEFLSNEINQARSLIVSFRRAGAHCRTGASKAHHL